MNYRVRMPDSEVALEVGKAAPGPAGWTRLSVRVEGAGPEEVLARIEEGLVTFQWRGRFFRAQVASSPSAKAASGTLEVSLRGEVFACVVERDSAALSVAAHHKAHGPVSVKAPMPGRVVALRVKAGDRVERGDLLLTLEAMKMQNEFASPVSGRVLEVRTAEGAVAGTDETLLVIEPAPPGGV